MNLSEISKSSDCIFRVAQLRVQAILRLRSHSAKSVVDGRQDKA